MAKSNSSDVNVGLFRRSMYLWKLVVMNWARVPEPASATLAQVKEIGERYRASTGRSPHGATALEIGFGARPRLAFAMQLVFGRVVAVDLDTPIFGPRDVLAAARTNGPLRAVKGLVRSVVFDRGEWPSFHAELRSISGDYDPARTRLCVANVADGAFWDENPGPYDLVYSTDVFEHIEKDDLVQALRHVRAHLAPGGLCIVIPCIFTGIVGGHDPDWYCERVDSNASDTAWSHLRDENFVVDTYLNRLTRRDYESLFEQEGFSWTTNRILHPDLGIEHLTEANRAALYAKYDDYELFSNWVEYLLRVAP